MYSLYHYRTVLGECTHLYDETRGSKEPQALSTEHCLLQVQEDNNKRRRKQRRRRTRRSWCKNAFYKLFKKLVSLFPCVLPYRWIHFSRSVLFKGVVGVRSLVYLCVHWCICAFTDVFVRSLMYLQEASGDWSAVSTIIYVTCTRDFRRLFGGCTLMYNIYVHETLGNWSDVYTLMYNMYTKL